MMQLPSRDGIACDMCGLQLRTDFSYMSYDMRHVLVTANMRPAWTIIRRLPIARSFDICPTCFNEHKTAIIANNSTKYKTQFMGVKCDLTGDLITGNYYHCNVSSVDVRMTGRPFRCTQCHSDCPKNAPCKCGSTSKVAVADTNVDGHFLELAVCEAIYNQLVDKSTTIQTRAADPKTGGWTTNVSV